MIRILKANTLGQEGIGRLKFSSHGEENTFLRSRQVHIPEIPQGAGQLAQQRKGERDFLCRKKKKKKKKKNNPYDLGPAIFCVNPLFGKCED